MILYIKLIVFVIGSGVVVWVSWESLKNRWSHGFYRFFAWELILFMLVINVDYWLNEPFSVYQVVSWVLLVLSLVWLIPGLRLMKRVGKPDIHRDDDPALLGMEKTSRLITTGIFKYIRNPLYSSLLFLAWGTFFKHPSWIGVCLAFSATVFLFVTAKMEEKENIRYFGAPYRMYMKKTKIFIPFVW